MIIIEKNSAPCTNNLNPLIDDLFANNGVDSLAGDTMLVKTECIFEWFKPRISRWFKPQKKISINTF